VDTRHFRPDGVVEERPPGLHRIVVVSRLVERKGIGNVICALADLPDTELVIAGGPPPDRLWSDPEACRLRALAMVTGVADRVGFRGRVERAALPALYRSAVVVACVPWYEPFGIVPLEAMACGVPVVASAVGGLIDTVVDGITGIHVPPRRPDLVAGAIASLLTDAERRADLGNAGVRRVRARYGWRRVAKATLDVYSRIAGAVPVGAEA
jgi:glycosyltransferase involved in cell wall biosynthesis